MAAALVVSWQGLGAPRMPGKRALSGGKSVAYRRLAELLSQLVHYGVIRNLREIVTAGWAGSFTSRSARIVSSISCIPSGGLNVNTS